MERNAFPASADLNADEARRASAAMDDAFRNLDAVYARNKEKLGLLNRELRVFRDSLEHDFSRALQKAVQGGDGFAGMFERMRTSLEDMVVRLAVINPAMSLLFGKDGATLGQGADFGAALSAQGGGLFGSISRFFSDMIAARAAGGPVAGRAPYLVGERGPELFVPSVSGRIVPNGTAGAAPVHITMNISTPDAASFRASQTQIAAQMLDAARRAGRIR